MTPGAADTKGSVTTHPDHDDHDQPSLFLNALFDGVEDGWASLFTGEHVTHWRHVTRTVELAQIANTLTDLDIWFGPATRKHNLGPNRRGGRADCDQLGALWADIDIAGPAHAEPGLPPDIDAGHQLLARYPLPPSILVHSGHGLQAWWLLAEPIPASIAEPLLARWGATWATKAAELGWRVDNVFNIDRVMRLPGTTNHKLGQAHPVAILHADWDLRYDTDELDEHTVDPPPPPEQRRTNPAGVPYIGPERPGDAYNARHTGSELLAGHGFTLTRRDRSGDEHWTRPGKDPREGASATVYASDGHTTIWSDTCRQQWPTLETRRPYDPFGLHAQLDHAGDWHAATKALARDGYGTVDDLHDFDHPSYGRHSSNGQNPLGGGGQNEPPPDETEPHDSWRRSDVAAVLAGAYRVPEPTILRRADGLHLLYPGRVNGMYGETEAAKSWLALCAAAGVLLGGGNVLYLDLEMGVEEIVERLRALGVPDHLIAQGLDHRQPDEPVVSWDRNGDQRWHPGNLAAWQDAYRAAHLVIVDTSAAWYELHGLDGMAELDVQRMARYLLEPMAKAGCCVGWVDHVVKDKETRGRWATGSQRKLSALTGVGYMVETLQPFGRGLIGQFRLTVGKDRPGYIRARSTRIGTADIAGVIELRSDPITGTIAWMIDQPDKTLSGDDGWDEHLLTRLCNTISYFYGTRGKWPTGNQIEQEKLGRAEKVRRHLARLVEIGAVAKEEAPGRGAGSQYRTLRGTPEEETL